MSFHLQGGPIKSQLRHNDAAISHERQEQLDMGRPCTVDVKTLLCTARFYVSKVCFYFTTLLKRWENGMYVL